MNSKRKPMVRAWGSYANMGGSPEDEGQWVYWNFLQEQCPRPRMKWIGFYTGQKDKNGDRIYEGDVLSFDGYMTADNSMGFEPNGYIYDETNIHPVIWNNKLMGWDLNFDKDDELKYKRDTRRLFCEGSCEIVGNVYCGIKEKTNKT